MPGFHGDGAERNPSPELEDALVRLLDAFREGTGGRAEPIVDLNSNLSAGVRRGSHAYSTATSRRGSRSTCSTWISLATVRRGEGTPPPRREPRQRPRLSLFLEAGAMDVASVDVIWNGFDQAKKIADLAEPSR